ncbi:MAG TPA: methyltransferase [Chryseosolibacter sp.]
MTATVWSNFWKKQDSSTHEIMKLSTSYFIKKMDRQYSLKSTDAIFDYGCGPGFMAEYLADKQIKLTGADINEEFIRECREKFPSGKFIVVTEDVEKNRIILDTELVGEKKFDYIILLSISQYFPSVHELQTLLKLLAGYLSCEGKMVVADVIQPTGSRMSDGVALLLHSFLRFRLLALGKFLTHIFTSNYRDISKETQLLALSSSDMEQIGASLLLSCTEVKGLTMHPGRTSYVFEHPKITK